MVLQFFALHVDVGEVDDEGEHGAEHEADGGLDAPAEGGAQHGERKGDVDAETHTVFVGWGCGTDSARWPGICRGGAPPCGQARMTMPMPQAMPDELNRNQRAKQRDGGDVQAAEARSVGPVQGRKLTPAAMEAAQARMRRSMPSSS